MVEIRTQLLELLEKKQNRLANQIANFLEQEEDCHSVWVCLERRCIYIWMRGSCIQQLNRQHVEVMTDIISIMEPSVCYLAIASTDTFVVNYYPIRQTIPHLPQNMNNLTPVHTPKTSRFEDLVAWVMAQTQPHALVDMTTQIRVACNQAYADATGVPLADCFYDAGNAGRWGGGELHRIIETLNAATDGVVEMDYLAQLKQFPGYDLPWRAKFQLIDGIEGRRYRLGQFLSIPSPTLMI